MNFIPLLPYCCCALAGWSYLTTASIFVLTSNCLFGACVKNEAIPSIRYMKGYSVVVMTLIIQVPIFDEFSYFLGY